MAIEMKKIRVKMTKPLYLGMSIKILVRHSYMNFGMTILD